MLPAFPVVESMRGLPLEIVELPAVSVPTFKTISPAGPVPTVSAPMCALARASVCAVIVMAPGVVAAVPPTINVPMTPWSRLTWAAGLPEPVTP